MQVSYCYCSLFLLSTPLFTVNESDTFVGGPRIVEWAPLDNYIEHFRERIVPLDRFLHRLTFSLDAPEFNRAELGFRFKDPGLVHFCLLRSVRIVSALSASIELARSGFPQEIAVLLRTMIEYASQIDFMLASRDANGKLSPEAAMILSDYFDDASRAGEPKSKKTKLTQKRVHDVVGAQLDKYADPGAKPASQLLSNNYFRFSYYVHARYPESMDLYGGRPGRFHLDGMRGTPKDAENIAILDSMITMASLCLKGVVQGLKLHQIVSSDPVLVEWLHASSD